MLGKFWTWFNQDSLSPELAPEQLRSVGRQIPLVYALLGVNAMGLAFTYRADAPAWITVWIPAALVAATVLRMIFWLSKPPKIEAPDRAVQKLRSAMVVGAIVACAYVAWVLRLAQYGDAVAQVHVAIFVALTLVGCIFCLAHAPQAALLFTAIVTIPFVLYYLTLGDPAFGGIALNILVVVIVMIRSLQSSFGGFAQLIRSQAETHRLHHEMLEIAHTDALTDLPNRRIFFMEVDRLIAERGPSDDRLALGIIDLDRFKAANDTFGHLLGDKLLQAVSLRLRETFGTEHLIARIGGDEFAFLVRGDAGLAIELAHRACAALGEPFHLDEATISIGASSGIATCGDLAVCSASSLYDKADYALYTAKDDRRGTVVVYCSAHEDRHRASRTIEAALLTADFEAELDVQFQPIVKISDDTIVGVEALARWTSPSVGSVGPDVFIPLAERAGIMQRLTLTLFSKTLLHAETLPDTLSLSFNLSAHDLTSNETILGIVGLVNRHGTNPKRIIFELTETAILRDFEAAQRSLALLRSLGASIAIDDFGTGYSSLQYLDQLPIDRVKIDRSFVNGAGRMGGGRLLTAVVALCHSMKMQCVAEGVETAEQHKFLRSIACDSFQGYYFAKPMPIAHLMKTVTQIDPAIANGEVAG